MTRRTITLDDELHDYLLSVSLREPAVLRELREATASSPWASMQIAPEQGQFMALLLRLIGARRTLEIGVFTGYSALVTALALPADGRVVACDTSKEWTAIARRYWQRAGVAERIDLRLGPAAATLRSLRERGEEGSYDFAFIDADKEGYGEYYEHCLALLRPGGLIAVDNVLWSGRVVDPAAGDGDSQALAAFNRRLYQDDRIDLSMLPLGDGLTLARKRG